MAEAFIKLYTKMLDWEWYDDFNTCRLFIHCLLRANWKAGSWHGIKYEAGQFITSLQNLSEETGLTVSQVRTALCHLQSTGEIANKSQSKFRVITVIKWNDYQGGRKQIRKQIATEEEYKDIKESKEKKNIYIVEIEKIIEYLNQVLGTKYTVKSKSTCEKITARLKEGHTFDDFKTVIDKKFRQWGGDPKMSKFLRPETLFAASHFESYLNEIEAEETKKPSQTANKKIHNFEERKTDYDELLKQMGVIGGS